MFVDRDYFLGNRTNFWLLIFAGKLVSVVKLGACLVWFSTFIFSFFLVYFEFLIVFINICIMLKYALLYNLTNLTSIFKILNTLASIMRSLIQLNNLFPRCSFGIGLCFFQFDLFFNFMDIIDELVLMFIFRWKRLGSNFSVTCRLSQKVMWLHQLLLDIWILQQFLTCPSTNKLRWQFEFL